MNRKTKYLIPAFAAVFAMMFVFAAPYVMAEDGDYHATWDGAKHHKKHRAIQIGELSGSESVTKENAHDKMSETIALSVVSNNYPDVKKASIGIAVNDAGEKFLVWKLVSMNKNDDGTKTPPRVSIPETCRLVRSVTRFSTRPWNPSSIPKTRRPYL